MTRRLTMLVVLEAELLEDRADVLLDGPLREHQRLRDRGVAPALGHLGEDLALARRQLVERRGVPLAVGGEELLDEARVDRGPALGDDLDRREQLAPVVDALLQEVAAALRRRPRAGRGRSAAPAYWLRTTTPTPGWLSRRRRATRIPSSSPDGGIRMSRMTTSGGSASIAARSASPSAYDPMRSTASSGPRTSCSASRIRYESSARRTRMGPSRSTPVPRARSDVRARAMSVPIDGSDDRVAVPVKWRLPTETLARPLGRAAGVRSPRTDRTAQPRRPQTTRSGRTRPAGRRAAPRWRVRWRRAIRDPVSRRAASPWRSPPQVRR